MLAQLGLQDDSIFRFFMTELEVVYENFNDNLTSHFMEVDGLIGEVWNLLWPSYLKEEFTKFLQELKNWVRECAEMDPKVGVDYLLILARKVTKIIFAMFRLGRVLRG